MRYILTISCLLTSLWAIAQPVALPLTSNPVLQEYVKTHPEEATSELKSPSAPLTLPFMDDFSYNGPYPTTELWMDNDAFVNNTLGINPLSIGVATLDGLDAEGLPYGEDEGWEADTLTSRPIDLSGLEDKNVVLSFFAQPQGAGDAPESIDKLALEFRDTSGVWVEIQEIGVPAVNDFQYYDYLIEEAYISENFQFRFRNHNARTGFVDLWHIDYIKINEGRTENDQSFEDVCFTEVPRSYLREFTAMPWAHYLISNQIALGAINFNLLTDVYNHNTDEENDVLIDFTAREVTTDVAIFARDENVDISPMVATEFDIYPTDIQSTNDWAVSDLSSDLTQAKITTQYTLTAEGQEVITNQQNFNRTNDTVTTETIFANYFAYDDGTAEYNVGLDGIGSQAAVLFRPNIDDELKAIQIHIPYAADDVSAGQLFTLKVWESDPNFGEPKADPIFSKQYTPKYGEGIGGFHTYEVDPIPLVGGQDYFIGWEQNTLADYGIPIGMDKNNPQASIKNYYNLGLGWQPFPSNLSGALMIRAVVNGDPLSINTESALHASEIAEIFPNPVHDNLFINLKSNNYADYKMAIFNSAGQLIYINQLQPSIPVNTLTNGIYFIQIKENNTNTLYYEKFIKK